MKTNNILTLLVLFFIPLFSLGKENQTDYKPKKSFGMNLEEGSLFELKNPNVTADIFIDYSNCIVNGNSSLDGADAINSEKSNLLVEALENGNIYGYKVYQDEFIKNKCCKLIWNGTDSNYKIYIQIKGIVENLSKVLATKTMLLYFHGLIFVYEKNNENPIAVLKFCEGGWERGFKDISYDKVCKINGQLLFKDLLKQIKKAKNKNK